MVSTLPPRTGKRTKGSTLSLLNNGKPFQIVKVNGEFAILKNTNPVTVYFLKNLYGKEICNADVVEPCRIPTPPDLAFEEEVAVIGGVGKTIRWNVVLPRRKNDNPALLFIANIFDQHEFIEFIQTLRPFAFHNHSFNETSNCGYSTYVDIPDNTKTGIVAAKLHYKGYGAILETKECQGKLGIERFDRSEHMWWNQDPKTAGPLRDTHRWKYPWCDWKFLPFNWHLLARNVLIPTDECHLLPLPLRNYVLRDRRMRALLELNILEQDDIDDKSMKKFLRKEISLSLAMETSHCVTSRLTDEQSRQLLSAAYFILVAPLDEEAVKISNLVQYMYCLHGYIGREVGGYRQNAQHLGHGKYIRKFRKNEQYNRSNMKNEVVNKIIQADGSLKGTGFKGSRGKYRHPDYKEYKPRNRMKRTATLEIEMRQTADNCFQDYKLQQ